LGLPRALARLLGWGCPLLTAVLFRRVLRGPPASVLALSGTAYPLGFCLTSHDCFWPPPSPPVLQQRIVPWCGGRDVFDMHCEHLEVCWVGPCVGTQGCPTPGRGHLRTLHCRFEADVATHLASGATAAALSAAVVPRCGGDMCLTCIVGTLRSHTLAGTFGGRDPAWACKCVPLGLRPSWHDALSDVFPCACRVASAAGAPAVALMCPLGGPAVGWRAGSGPTCVANLALELLPARCGGGLGGAAVLSLPHSGAPAQWCAHGPCGLSLPLTAPVASLVMAQETVLASVGRCGTAPGIALGRGKGLMGTRRPRWRSMPSRPSRRTLWPSRQPN
jgi:hypothetical protein